MRPKIALFEPRIPQNTGSIARTCAAFKIQLNLIKPLGFSLEDKYLKRAGLDYWKYLDIKILESYQDLINNNNRRRVIAFTKKGDKKLNEFKFANDDLLIFGREDSGLPQFIQEASSSRISIPMPGGHSMTKNIGVRSLNLSVSCGIAIYTALQQLCLLD